MNLYPDISEVFKDIFIEDYYDLNYKEEFYKSIIEKENEIQSTTNLNENSIKELCLLYKKGIDLFKGNSKKKTEFFTNKLFNLILGKSKNKKYNSKKLTNWSYVIKKNRKNVNNFILSTTLEFSKYRVKSLMEELNNKINKGISKIYEDLFIQENKFNQNKKNKKTFSKKELNVQFNFRKNSKKFSENNIFHKDEKVELFIKQFFQKFYNVYLNINLFEKQIDITNEIFNQIYFHKITKYLKFQDLIKQFELLLKENIDDKDQNESFKILLEDLQKEKIKYFVKIELIYDKIRIYLKNNNQKIILKNNQEINSIKLHFLSNLFSIFN